MGTSHYRQPCNIQGIFVGPFSISHNYAPTDIEARYIALPYSIQLTYQATYQLTYQRTYQLTYWRTYQPTFQHTYKRTNSTAFESTGADADGTAIPNAHNSSADGK